MLVKNVRDRADLHELQLVHTGIAKRGNPVPVKQPFHNVIACEQ